MTDELTFAIVSIPPRFVMALSSLSTIPAKSVCGGDRVYTCGKPSPCNTQKAQATPGIVDGFHGVQL